MTGPIPAIFDSKNIRVSLDRQIAAGGEGAIFSIANDPHRVAKIYHPERKPSAIHCNKLRLMIALGQQRPDLPKITAWPLETVHNSSNREITGFLMPRLVNFQLVQNLYNPVQRAKTFPKAGWAFQVRAAKNIAAAFEQIHNAGCLMGDVNESNIMIAEKDATARLIDCDSFQIVVGGNRHLCEVGKPDFTPPELQGKSLRGIVRTANHDRFGLAIIIYRLLFVGRHPYAGIYLGKDEPTFEEHIAKFRFAQGPAARSSCRVRGRAASLSGSRCGHA
jgi:DNA-binding helix-hairpin-helix protein with protein kinase domain